MRIKKYKADSLHEGKARILAELGDDAIILSSRTVKPTTDDKKEYIEIVAASDNKPIVPNDIQQILSSYEQQQSVNNQQKGDKNFFNIIYKLQTDVTELKSIIHDISDRLRYKYNNPLSEALNIIYRELTERDISEETALKIVGQISTTGLDDNLQQVKEKARKLLTKSISLMPPLEKKDKRQIVTFIGPTGNGKTLSLVKLAIITKLLMKANVMIISADTEKVGGADQLHSYATIASIEFASVFTPKELKKVLANETDRDYIFIDTTGRSQNDTEHMKELNMFIDWVFPDYIFLVQSCTNSKATIIQSIERFLKLQPNGIILTKFDEAASWGNIIEALNRFDIPLAYFTTGQKIPEDIEPASKEFLGKLILP